MKFNPQHLSGEECLPSDASYYTTSVSSMQNGAHKNGLLFE